MNGIGLVFKLFKLGLIRATEQVLCFRSYLRPCSSCFGDSFLLDTWASYLFGNLVWPINRLL